jgi:hypothetical protein
LSSVPRASCSGIPVFKNSRRLYDRAENKGRDALATIVKLRDELDTMQYHQKFGTDKTADHRIDCNVAEATCSGNITEATCSGNVAEASYALRLICRQLTLNGQGCPFYGKTMTLLCFRRRQQRISPAGAFNPASQKTAFRKLYERTLRSYCPRNRGICFIVAASELDLTKEDQHTKRRV